MKLEEFLKSAAGEEAPPESLSATLRALWFAERGEWEMAHTVAQEINSRDGSWIHAHLHREEGDLWNARYWYERAAKPESKKPLAEERREIIAALLG